MVKKIDFDKEWLCLFYERVTNQFTLSRQSFHNTHQWVNTLSFGLIAAILTIIQSNDHYPNEMGFIVLLLSFPLVLRFFIRSCLEYSIQYKWQIIRNQMDEYFIEDNETNKEKLMKSIKNYYFDWKSPITVWKILWDNFILAYYWIFFLYAGLILWGILTLKFTTLMYVSSFSVIIVLVIEGFFFFRIKGFSIKE